jgi:transcriptional regulator with GAF, ATPase, and Fis domain
VSDTVSAIVSRAPATRVRPALYVGLCGENPQSPGARIGLGGVDRIEIGRGDVRRMERSKSDGAQVLTIALTDSRMSSQHARLSRVGATWVVEDLGSKNGTWVGRRRISRHRLADRDALVVGHTALVFREHGGEDDDVEQHELGNVPGLDTLSVELAARFKQVAKAARESVPIEIQGETGTGKELVARAVHALSGRSGKLAAINCGALPATLIEAELFGHRKGAFTNALEDRPGLVRTADNGTLFLDEVGELPLPAQAALLRVLQEGEVTPIGGDRPIKVDVRIVTATHRDLAADVEAGRFRADLRARLLGVVVPLPPLRDRIEDLGFLAATLLRRVAPDREIAFSADALGALYAHDWPMNIRELERVLGAAAAVADGRIDLEHLPPAFAQAPPKELDEDDEEIRRQLMAAMERHGGNISAVARDLGKDRTQIRRWVKRFGL